MGVSSCRRSGILIVVDRESNCRQSSRDPNVHGQISRRGSRASTGGLMGLIQDLYAAHKENRTFLHARFGVGGGALRPYKETLDRCSGPTYCGTRIRSVAKANRQSRITEKLSVTRREWRNRWSSTVSAAPDSATISAFRTKGTSTHSSACSNRLSRSLATTCARSRCSGRPSGSRTRH